MDTSVHPVPRNYFSKEISALKFFGLSILGNDSIPYKIYSAIFVITTVYLYNILAIYEYFKQDLNGIADLIIYQAAGCLSGCKATVVFLNRAKLTTLLDKLEQELFLANFKRGGDKEQELIDECLWITKIQTYTYWILTVATVSFTFAFGAVRYFLWHDRILLYGPLTIVNTTYSPNYEIIQIYQCVCMVNFALFFTTIDLLLAAVLVHLCYQFKMLQNNIRRLTIICYEEMKKDAAAGCLEAELSPNSNLWNGSDNSVIPWRYLKKSLKKVVQYHLAIIDIAAELEEVFNNLFLLVFLGTLAILCFSVYFAAAISSNSQVILRHLGEGSCACMQIAIVCYWGEQVVHESQEVGRAVAESNFVGTDLRYQKMLAFIIRRSQNPTKFTAGKFTVLCLATFAWTLRTSYSSFMILRRANDDGA